MSEELKLNDRLAIDRTRLAAERSLMAWIRTALSMIAFGFTIYKFLQAIQQQTTATVYLPNAPRNLGLFLVGLGTVALALACIQNQKYLRKLDPSSSPWNVAFIVAILMCLLGLVVFWSILYTSGPFG